MSAPPLHRSTVTVIGGGLAGISAALEAADMGASVTLVERKAHLGGLTWSFEHNGIEMDNGQHVFLACCSEYRRFLTRIGSERDVVGPFPLDVPVLAETAGGAVMATRLRRSNLPVPFHLAGSLLSYPHISPAERVGLGRALAGLARLRLGDPHLDQVNFFEWLRRHGQSPRAIEAVWDLITVPTVNLPASQASLAVAAQVFKTGLLSDRSACDIGWSAIPLGRLHGQRAFAALRRQGVALRTSARVRSIVKQGPTWEVVTDSETLESDAVIVAVPHDEAATLVPGDVAPARDNWRHLGSSAVVDVHLIFDRTVTVWPLMAALHSPVQWVFDRSSASGLTGAGRQPQRGGTGPQYLAVSISAADELLGQRPAAIVKEVTGALRRLLPASADAALVDSVVTKERRATFRAVPGTAGLRAQPAKAQQHLAIAGAWTDTGWPATMEGAVRSGIAAARAIAGLTPSQLPTYKFTELQPTREVA